MRSSLVPILAIIALTAVVVLGLFAIRQTPEESEPTKAAPLVRTRVARAEPHRFTVTAHGEVMPRTESELIPQVTGEVVWISPDLAAGGFFEAGDALARIDDADYRVELEAARAAVARAQSDHARTQKELQRQRRLADRSVSSEARIDDAVNAFKVAEAVLREARARLERAERDLVRTEIRAPYRGRVRSEQVDVGQFVERGKPIATLYAVDFAEVRLPLPDRELAYLDVPLVPTARAAPEGADAADAAGPEAARAPRGPRVRLHTEFAGALHEWEGVLVRTEAELDPRSRMVHVVARVPDPYGLESPRSAPLAVGLFVEAEIEGRRVERAFVLPRDVLRGDGRVYVIDAEGRLRFRDVEILRTERQQVVLADGLVDGERVCTSPLEAAIDGMEVRVAEAEPGAEAASAERMGAEPRSGVDAARALELAAEDAREEPADAVETSR